jgi:ubiquitin conjugation factor E4 B
VDKTTPNFISDIFFLLNAFQHLGLNKTISTRLKAEKNIHEIEKELKRAEASRGDWAGVRWTPSRDSHG